MTTPRQNNEKYKIGILMKLEEYKPNIPFGELDHCLEVGGQGLRAKGEIGIQEAVASGCIDEHDGVRTTQTGSERESM